MQVQGFAMILSKRNASVMCSSWLRYAALAIGITVTAGCSKPPGGLTDAERRTATVAALRSVLDGHLMEEEERVAARRSLGVLSQPNWRSRVPFVATASMECARPGLGLYFLRLRYLADPDEEIDCVVRAGGDVVGGLRLASVFGYVRRPPPDHPHESAATYAGVAIIPVYVESDESAFPFNTYLRRAQVSAVRFDVPVDVGAMTVQLVSSNERATADEGITSDSITRLEGANAETYLSRARQEWKEWCSSAAAAQEGGAGTLVEAGLHRLAECDDRPRGAFWEPCLLCATWRTQGSPGDRTLELVWLDAGRFIDTIVVHVSDNSYAYAFTPPRVSAGSLLVTKSFDLDCVGGVISIVRTAGRTEGPPCRDVEEDFEGWSVSLMSSDAIIEETDVCPVSE